MWKRGTSETVVPNAVNTTTGAMALRDYFVHPPIEELNSMNFEFDHAAAATGQTARINDAVSTDLSTYSAPRRKVDHLRGLSDPVFSADDIIDYYRQLESENGGTERSLRFARLFLIPGMTHCAAEDRPPTNLTRLAH